MSAVENKKNYGIHLCKKLIQTHWKKTTQQKKWTNPINNRKCLTTHNTPKLRPRSHSLETQSWESYHGRMPKQNWGRTWMYIAESKAVDEYLLPTNNWKQTPSRPSGTIITLVDDYAAEHRSCLFSTVITAATLTKQSAMCCIAV